MVHCLEQGTLTAHLSPKLPPIDAFVRRTGSAYAFFAKTLKLKWLFQKPSRGCQEIVNVANVYHEPIHALHPVPLLNTLHLREAA